MQLDIFSMLSASNFNYTIVFACQTVWFGVVRSHLVQFDAAKCLQRALRFGSRKFISFAAGFADRQVESGFQLVQHRATKNTKMHLSLFVES